MNAAAYEVRQGLKRYHLGTTPLLLPFDEDILEKFGWGPPDDAGLDRLSDTTDALRLSLEYSRYWTIDLQTEAQNVFLGELFGTQVEPRINAPEHAPFVITLEKHEALVEQILKETAWGKDISPRLVRPPLG